MKDGLDHLSITSPRPILRGLQMPMQMHMQADRFNNNGPQPIFLVDLLRMASTAVSEYRLDINWQSF